MTFFDRLIGLWNRLTGYPLPEVAGELLVIGLFVYAVIVFVRGTRAAGALKGVFFILIVATIVARVLGSPRLTFLYDRFLAIAAVGLVVIFQPELRRALVRIGEAPFFRTTPRQIATAVEAIADACIYLSKAKFGALIVLQRQVGLAGLVAGGTPLGAELSAPLLQTIFFPGSALHDLAVVVQGNVIRSAKVQLPLAEPSEMPDPRLGSRHRAAVGLTKECDALVVVVSEETGQIRLAERGRLSDAIPPKQLAEALLARLKREPPPSPPTAAEAAESAAEPAPEAVAPTKA